MTSIPTLRLLVVSTVAAIATAIAALSLNTDQSAAVAMHLSPTTATVGVGNTVRLTVTVESPIPVNAFSGEVIFDSTNFEVASISYNTSLANLWVEEPWYSRADNSVYFAGGTTARGGFTGKDTLLEITLRATTAGNTDIALNNVRILLHDGLGTDATVTPTIDSVFTSATTTLAYTPATIETAIIEVNTTGANPDVNGDGLINFLDIGTLIRHLGSTDARYDLNGDGQVTTRDFAVVQAAR